MKNYIELNEIQYKQYQRIAYKKGYLRKNDLWTEKEFEISKKYGEFSIFVKEDHYKDVMNAMNDLGLTIIKNTIITQSMSDLIHYQLAKAYSEFNTFKNDKVQIADGLFTPVIYL